MSEKICIEVTTPIFESFRTAQIGGMFDMPIANKATTVFQVEPPPLEEPWRIGLIVGPSGSGKSTLAAHLFPDDLYRGFPWADDKAVLDNFDERPTKDIVETLTMVGFSSPPGWIKPYHVLSNGEKFRCDLAKALLDSPGETIVFDEFTSVVDRNVARVASAALARSIELNRITKRFVAVSCHYDIMEWLTPDWALDMATGRVARRKLRRPAIKLAVVRTDRALWPLFARHHYLSGSLGPAAQCFCALWENRPVAFCALLPLMGHKGRKRVSRLVTLPDYQGIGIGGALLNAMGQLCKNNGIRLNITTSHPAMVTACRHSPLWKTVGVSKTQSAMIQFKKKYRGSAGRAVVSFEYCGP
ncbi:MAG: GNAT family N-acetyltransferase [Thermoguttaceae bacterium]|nr:GNAT family N-acetyltransferase [Thermoguttaceae bacterium]